ncbi:hypothetical protein BOTBODRAFT_31459 [Botryobasidium botryosum FD-172 SS1]|uniref:Gfd2/YDR514C-like C-terminal domain-containing protein n=1 Tax=Botryobasidium botryosum (strain FD-172 SS1) TaxID=930990 RepID=A0A067MUL2_BOTB1|nr:hypothetical protein BOTBODRAFT_31459 [Botryobasidium botryosum FD-172 SS1]
MSGSDFTLVQVQGWEWDLHSVYAAYLGHFQTYNIPWYDRSWGNLFVSFDAFLSFGWPVVVVTDSRTGRAHIVTRSSSVLSFSRMVKTRFGEHLPKIDNMLHVTPFEQTPRHLRTLNDYNSYRKLYASLPAAVLSALKARARHGDPKTIQKLWEAKDKTFLSLRFEWSEKSLVVLEAGFAAVRCAPLDALGVWPPVPDANYRKGHFIVQEYVDKVRNKQRPTFPWEYAFGESQVVNKSKLTDILQAVIDSHSSPDSETLPNTLVFVGHGIAQDLERLTELKIKLPNNTVIIDTAAYERQLHLATSANESSRTSPTRAETPLISLSKLLRNLSIPVQCPVRNSGNSSFLTLLAMQWMLGAPTKVPSTIPPSAAAAAAASSQYMRGVAPYGAMGMNMTGQAVPFGAGMVGYPATLHPPSMYRLPSGGSAFSFGSGPGGAMPVVSHSTGNGNTNGGSGPTSGPGSSASGGIVSRGRSPMPISTSNGMNSPTTPGSGSGSGFQLASPNLNPNTLAAMMAGRGDSQSPPLEPPPPLRLDVGGSGRRGSFSGSGGSGPPTGTRTAMSSPGFVNGEEQRGFRLGQSPSKPQPQGRRSMSANASRATSPVSRGPNGSVGLSGKGSVGNLKGNGSGGSATQQQQQQQQQQQRRTSPPSGHPLKNELSASSPAPKVQEGALRQRLASLVMGA